MVFMLNILFLILLSLNNIEFNDKESDLNNGISGIISYEVDTITIVKERWENKVAKVVEVYVYDIKIEEKGYHSNGMIGYEGFFKNNKKHGVWIWWDENGNVLQRVTLSEGNLYGIATTYYLNQNKESEGFYINGLEMGLWQFWNEDGSKHVEIDAEKGLENGKFIEYYRNGGKKIVGRNKNGEREGEWLLFDESGENICTAEYHTGTLLKMYGKCEKF